MRDKFVKIIASFVCLIAVALLTLAPYYPKIAPVDAKYLVQTADPILTNEQDLSALSTGYTKVTTGTGVLSSQAVPIPISDGGTNGTSATSSFNNLSPTTTQGDIIYRDGSNNVRLAAGTNGQFFKTAGAGANPSWASQFYVVPLEGGSAAGHSPADSQTYFLGMLAGFNPGTSADAHPHYIFKAGTVRQAWFRALVQGTLGSTENVTLDVFNTLAGGSTATASITTTAKFNAIRSEASNTSLSMSVAVGDKLEIRITTPAWATNPTTITYIAWLLIEVP